MAWNKETLAEYRDLWRGHAKVYFECDECNAPEQNIACPLPDKMNELKDYTHVCLARWEYWKKKWGLK